MPLFKGLSRIILVGITFVLLGACATYTVYVPQPPPRVKVEVKSVRPHHRASWIPGHWKWIRRAHRYVWIPGHWERSPVGHIWIAGYWKSTPHGWVWIKGHWR